MEQLLHFLLATLSIFYYEGVDGQIQVENCDTSFPTPSPGGWTNASTSLTNNLCLVNFTTALNTILGSKGDAELEDTRIMLTLFVEPTEAANLNPLVFILKGDGESHKVLALPYAPKAKKGGRLKVVTWGEEGPPNWVYESATTVCINPSYLKNQRYDKELLVMIDSYRSISPIHFGLKLSDEPGLLLGFSEDRKNFDGVGPKTMTTPAISPPKSIWYRFDYNWNFLLQDVTIVVNAVDFGGKSPPCTRISLQTSQCPIYDNEQTVDFEGSSQLVLKKGIMYFNGGEWRIPMISDEKDKYARHGYDFALVLVVLEDDEECQSHHPDKDITLSVLSDRWVVFNISVIPSYWDKYKGSGYIGWVIPFFYVGAAAVGAIVFLLNVHRELCRRFQLEDGKYRNVVGKKPKGPRYLGDLIRHGMTNGEGGAENAHDILVDVFSSNVHYVLAIIFVLGVRILTISALTDVDQCFYNQACSYQAQFKLGEFTVKFFTLNAIVSSLTYFCYGSFLVWVIRGSMKDEEIDQAHDGVEEDAQPLQPRPGQLGHLVLDAEAGENREESSDADEEEPDPPPQNQPGDLGLQLNQGEAEPIVPPEVEPGELGILPKGRLDVALALLLIFEGILSALYHVCANASTFLIDAPILDLILLLAWIRIFNLRYPFYLNSFYATILAMINIFFEFVFTLMHFSHQLESTGVQVLKGIRLFYFNVQVFLHVFYIYYLGHYTKDENGQVMINVWEMFKLWVRKPVGARLCSGLGIQRKADFFLLALTLIVNTAVIWTLFALSLHKGKDHLMDGNRLLEITEYNIIFALACHFLKKWYYEPMNWRLDIIPGLYFLIYGAITIAMPQGTTDGELFDWTKSQAESEELAEVCVDEVYDRHDYYHVVRSTGLFFLLLTFQALDMNCLHLNRDLIRVF